MEFRKNDLVTLEIEDCGIDGEGIGKADGFAGASHRKGKARRAAMNRKLNRMCCAKNNGAEGRERRLVRFHSLAQLRFFNIKRGAHG